MAAKYTIGQKVKIVSVKDQSLKMRLTPAQVKPYVSKSGTIVDSYWVGQEGIGMEGVDVPRETYIYTVRIENKEVKGIPEECLEPYVD